MPSKKYLCGTDEVSDFIGSPVLYDAKSLSTVDLHSQPRQSLANGSNDVRCHQMLPQSTQPVNQVSRITPPKAMRYQANGT